jgi:MEDS: MEthanogen/methylotroph, DcmR Sensory domain
MTAGRQRQEAARSGDHIILIYQNRTDLTAFAVPFVNEGLAGGERCVYVTAGSSAAEVTRELSAAGARIIRRSRPGAGSRVAGAAAHVVAARPAYATPDLGRRCAACCGGDVRLGLARPDSKAPMRR